MLFLLLLVAKEDHAVTTSEYSKPPSQLIYQNFQQMRLFLIRKLFGCMYDRKVMATIALSGGGDRLVGNTRQVAK